MTAATARCCVRRGRADRGQTHRHDPVPVSPEAVAPEQQKKRNAEQGDQQLRNDHQLQRIVAFFDVDACQNVPAGFERGGGEPR